MTTLFGEIVEPVSRAIFDDYSSDEDDQDAEPVVKTRELKWCDGSKPPSSIGLFLLVQGRLAQDFVQNCILKEGSKVAEVVEVVSSERKPAYFVPGLPLSIHLLSSGNVYVCTCPSIDIFDANSVHESLLPLLQLSKEVVIITSAPAPLYKCSDPTLDLPPSFMRVLHSAKYCAKNIGAAPLEQPNIVSGVPASVLSWCEVFNKPGCLYICYSDSEEMDSISSQPLAEIFSKLPFQLLNTSKINFKTVHKPSSNLYM